MLGKCHKASGWPEPSLGTAKHHPTSQEQRHLHYLWVPSGPARVVCHIWQVPGLAARGDSETRASPWLHLQSPHSQSILTSSSDSLGVAWKQQYRHGNSGTGMATWVLEERQNARGSLLPWSASASWPLCAPRDLQQGTAAVGATSFAPYCLALHEISCGVSARIWQVLASRQGAMVAHDVGGSWGLIAGGGLWKCSAEGALGHAPPV